MENINFFILFLSFLFIEQVIEIYLSFRNRISIKNNRNQVPDDFKETISLKDHQKAAEYQLTLIDFGFFFRIYGLLVLLLWTIGGYLSRLSFYSSTLTNNDYLANSFLQEESLLFGSLLFFPGQVGYLQFF